ncbi:MAG: hypothetical protein QOI10_396 [Solirubrobacterales bacterium]|jgi:hypothetical protein|nr:hypothetical protein [Solirubrobacterales bacterium]
MPGRPDAASVVELGRLALVAVVVVVVEAPVGCEVVEDPPPPQPAAAVTRRAASVAPHAVLRRA